MLLEKGFLSFDNFVTKYCNSVTTNCNTQNQSYSYNDNLSTKEEKNLDNLTTYNNEILSKTLSKENNQRQAQDFDSGRLNDQDDLFPTKEESREEKYRREQEEIAKWK